MTETTTIMALDASTSANWELKPTGVDAPADALGVTKRMTDLDADGQESTECPSCDRTFETSKGMKLHHVQMHGESLAGVERTCERCGDTFRVNPAYVKRGGGRYCSHHCAGKHATPGESVVRECKWCAQEFEAKKAIVEDGRGKFCSGSCYGQWLSENNTGEDHPNWKGGYTEYRGTHWPKLRHRVIKSHDHQCDNCGRSQEDHRDEYGVGLHCHHIRPVTEFDEPEDADTVDNLVPLCRDCHLERHSHD